jgi:hypothetical protein
VVVLESHVKIGGFTRRSDALTPPTGLLMKNVVIELRLTRLTLFQFEDYTPHLPPMANSFDREVT